MKRQFDLIPCETAVTDAGLEVTPLRPPTKRQRAALDAEADRVRALLSRP